MADKAYDPEQGLPSAEEIVNDKEEGNVIGGLKASLSNDNNSEEAKQANKAQLEEIQSKGGEEAKFTASS